MSTVQQRFLASMCGEESAVWFALHLNRTLFEADPLCLPIFDYFQTHARQWTKLPGQVDVAELFKVHLPKEPAQPQTLFVLLREAHVRRRLAIVTSEQQQVVTKAPFAALAAIHEEVQGLMQDTTNVKVANFKDALLTAWPWLLGKWSGSIKAVPLVWPTLHNAMGGVHGGELVSTVGRPGLGKSWTQLMLAYHIWRELDQPVLFFSMEMMERKVQERLMAIHTRTPADFFKDGFAPNLFEEDRKVLVQKALLDLHNSDRAPFHIVDANLTATLEDVVALANTTKACAVFVDGAYMLRTGGREDKGHQKIETICHDLKGRVATDMDVPVFASWQFNREAEKLKKGNIPMLSQIAGGDTIGMISSVVMGLVDATGEELGDIETLETRRLHVIKGRDGEQGTFTIDWSFNDMQFRELQGFQLDYPQKE